ncbi:MAG: hypothetical protein KDI49_00405 [Gammaproteobacteria bacterium]|nr:hypothetical protein [Gammaproteobacteria bacterium]
MSTKPQDPKLQQDIAAIEDKRRILEQMVNIAQAIEHLQVSLESVLILGAPSSDLPEEALNLYSSISDSLRNLPVNKIKEYLKNLEAIIRRQLEQILHFSGTDLTADDSVELLFLSSDGSDQTPLEMLEEFKRTAQTAISLRVLLRRRGVASAGSPLPVARETIEQQIALLEVEEKKQRSNVRQKVSEMKDEIAKMIENPAYPEGLKEILKGVRRNLEKDLNSIDKGHKLSSLSFVTDAGEITDIQEVSCDESASADAAQEQERSLSESARLWLNTPWDVSWEDVRQRR